MTARLCWTCELPIPEARLRAVPDARYCVEHQPEELIGGNMVWSHKTAPELELKPLAQAKAFPSRRGFHAQLPLSSPTNPRMDRSRTKQWDIESTKEFLKTGDATTMGVAEYDSLDVGERARCHPTRPRVSPAGLCLECAVAWYGRRV